MLVEEVVTPTGLSDRSVPTMPDRTAPTVPAPKGEGWARFGGTLLGSVWWVDMITFVQKTMFATGSGSRIRQYPGGVWRG